MFSFAISFTREMMAAFSSRGGGSWLKEHAVHAVADAKFFLERLDVNVAGALFDGLGDHGVHQADDGRLARHVAQVLEILAGFNGFPLGPKRLLFFRLAVVPVDRVDDLLFARECRLDFEATEAADRRDGFEIERIGHGNGDRRIIHGNGKKTALAHEARREALGLR